MHRKPHFAFILFLLFPALVIFPNHANAHVKWFCGALDLRVPPLPLHTVLSAAFFGRGVTFLALVSAGSLLDAIVLRQWPRLPGHSAQLEIIEELVIRLGVGGYALSLWSSMAVVPWAKTGDGAILTPDLFDRDALVSIVQLSVVAMLILRRTCPLAGLGLIVLYCIGVSRYGLFHMVDYVFFLGLANYLILSSPDFEWIRRNRLWRVPLLTGTLGFSLMWTAIEKFLYPGWTDIVLAVHPDITLGFPSSFVTLTAGFVEFSLAFYLVVGRTLLRPGALLFMLIFISAIPEFGKLDAFGHLPIIAIFLVIVMHGPTRLQATILPTSGTAIRSTMSVAVLYTGSLITLMGLYYGLQKTTWW
ncbi:hypothetical protein [Acidisoma cladoniae]|jgi:hypothetical protein|uniref:hypothetical protein n=1 Tax=Acidisoma cladoniae TaxID=3040935 RepID=UPI00254DCF9A|nr:hypothetical protein [Acidisoma sp. PAMC 29798]